LRVAVAHAIKLSGWRDANADPIAAPYAKDRVENPKQQKGAIFRRTTVLVCAMVASILQELVKQIAIEHRRTAGNVPRLSPSVQHCAGWQRVKQVGGPGAHVGFTRRGNRTSSQRVVEAWLGRCQS
jgi:hypothetical protein